MTDRDRRRTSATIKRSMRELSNQISLLNRRVSSAVELKDRDLDVLDLISQVGPIGPSALARRAGLHPATLTGILDRLERDEWIAREQDPADRRGTVIRALPQGTSTLYGHYSGMNASMDELCERYSEKDLDVIADFLKRATEAGTAATEEFSA
jgi:DNA-binding MarR family transcriptional regulator